MKRKRIPRSKVKPRPKQVHEDTRTQRERSRSDQVRAAIQRELDQIDEVLDDN